MAKRSGLLLALVLVTACTDAGVPVKSDDGPPKPTLSRIQASIFAPSCAFTSCHSPAGFKGDLDLSNAAVSHNGLVGELASNAAARQAGKLRVVPGHPDSSFLITKLTAPAPGEGDRMPWGVGSLHSDTIQIIRDWIAAGAAAD